MADLVIGVTANVDSAVLGMIELGKHVWEFAKSSVDAFAEQERADARLSSALKQLGYDAAALAPQFKAQAQAFQDTLGVSKQLVERMDALMLRYGEAPRDIKATTQAILDYSAATGIDAERATMMLERAIDNGGKGLQRMGVHIDITGNKTKDLEAATKALGARWAGAAAAQAETFDGKLIKLGREFTDIKEGLGRIFVEIATKTHVIDDLSSAVRAARKLLTGEKDEAELRRDEAKAAEEVTAAEKALARAQAEETNALFTQAGKAKLVSEATVELANAKEKLNHAQRALTESIKSANTLDSTKASDKAAEEEEAGLDALEAKRQAAADKEFERQQKLIAGFKKVTEENIKLEEETDALIVSEEKTLDAEHERRLKKRVEDEEKAATGMTRIHQDFETKSLQSQVEHAKKAAEFKKKADEEQIQLEKKFETEIESIVDKEAKQIIKGLIDMAITGKGSFQDLAQAALQSIAEQAGVEAIMEGAKAIASYADNDYADGSLHLQAAAQFGAVAGIAMAGAIGFAQSEKHHDGGWAGNERPKYHDGGWAEVPATLLRGERVLSHAEVDRMGGPHAVDAAARGGGGPMVGVVQIQAFDAVGVRDMFMDRGGRGLSQALRTGHGGYLTRMFGRS